MDDMLGVMRGFQFGDDVTVRQDIIDEVSAHGAEVAEVIDLHRRRPQRQDSGTAIFGKPGQIDGNIDFQTADEAGDLTVALSSHIVKCAERLFQIKTYRPIEYKLE